MTQAPKHPGEVLKQYLDRWELPISRTAANLQVHRVSLHRILAGRSNIEPDLALRLEAALGVEADYWLSLQHEYDLWVLRQQNAQLLPQIQPMVDRRQMELQMA